MHVNRGGDATRENSAVSNTLLTIKKATRRGDVGEGITGGWSSGFTDDGNTCGGLVCGRAGGCVGFRV